MAPEVIRGEAQDERTDLWALGVVLFEMLTGALPFSGRNRFDLAAAIVHGPRIQLPDTLPGPLAHVVTRLLSSEPSGRYASAAETAAALDTLREPAAPAPGPLARSRVYYAIAALVLTALTATALWWLRRDVPFRLGEQRLISATAT